VTAAWVAALTGNRVELGRRLRMLQSMVGGSPLPDGTTSPQSALVLVRAMFGFDGPEQMLADAHRAVDLESDGDTPWSAVAHAALGYAGYLTANVALARQHLGDAARAPAAPAMIRVLAVGTLALCEAEQGNLTRSMRLGVEAMELVTEHGLQAMPQAIFAFTGYGASLAGQNRLTEAQAVLQEGLDVRRRTAALSPWPLVHHLLTLAAVAARSDDEATTEELLTEVDDLTPWTGQSMVPTRNRVTAVQNLLNEPSRPTPPAVGDSLTPREQQILRRLHGTQTLNEIAADLYVSRNTVKTITSSLYRKLGAHSRAEAINIARHLPQDSPPALSD
jgi:LuxR family maltose regulon positive regulatory protein